MNLHPSHGFGDMLEPPTFSARGSSTSELLRTLLRVAASKPTSWLSGDPHILVTLGMSFGALADDLGCFPFDHEPYHP